jgi:hypothetical protein
VTTATKSRRKAAPPRAALPSAPPAVDELVEEVADSDLDFDAQLDGAELSQRTVEVCLRGDLYTKIEELDLELKTLIDDNADRAVDPDAIRKAREIEAVRAEMRRYIVKVVIEAMPQPDFTRLEAEHPPRPDNPADLAADCNLSTMTPLMLRASILSPTMTDVRWEKFRAKINDGQYKELGAMAWAVNRRAVTVPFSRTALNVLTSALE